ncbi:hypothetical protein OQ968_18490 [Mycobacterium sp. 663a-19]|uniref:sunset domain-containing protein n=1 Tax=Mycobacterium sp. 663a-19 TaxID=2986148 RepID=UPI002D1F0A87|nr:hypothetical protein [Mycobacterium sp. 663a-19]MEB3983248.1 hypothetical protein [Mycobacterium sp. 663a-19]
MKPQRGPLRRLFGRALVSMAAAVVAAAFLAPTASASPIGDAEAAIMAAWEKAGGDSSPLGPRKGDVYPVGDGFALDFGGGKMFYTTDTGAKFVYGPILDKYEALGGPANSDLGFPTINEVPGLAGPDSRVATFSASDKPVIFWTSEHGAFVVRGAMNAAWDKLGSSGGVLGAPVGDETYDGEVTSQKFTGGLISWNRKTKDFSTTPPVLADQLKGLQVATDPTAAINMAWRAAGGASGPLGAKQGGQYPIGGDGIAQNFAGGKVFFSQATGANAVESDVLAKYESLGGPVGSDLGFPIANESDGGVPGSRVSAFAAADKPVIFWTSQHGAFVVRGAMKAAWDKLRGPGGKLGVPVADQAVDGDVISQKFAGGKISWNRAKNTFATEPSNLAPLLSGLQVSGQNQPSGAAMPPHAKKFAWNWWYLLALIPIAALFAVLGYVVVGARRRRTARELAAYEFDRDVDVGGYDADDSWGHEEADVAAEHYGFGEPRPSEEEPVGAGSARVSWSRGDEAGDEYGGEWPSGSREDEQEDPDAVDTDSIPVVAEGVVAQGVRAEPEHPEAAPEDVLEAAYPDEEYPEAADIEAAYPDVAVPHAPADAAHPDEAYPPAAPEAVDSGAGYPDVAVPHTAPDVAAPGAVTPAAAPRSGRHAAVDTEEEPAGAGLGSPGRPTIHLPLDDPYQAPEGYPIKVNASFGLYYTPDSGLYQDTLAELWMSSEEVAQVNGFTRAD